MSLRFIPRSKTDAALLAFVSMTLVHLVAQVLHRKLLMDVSQVLLMPPLALWLFLSTRTPRLRSTWLALVGLAFSWLGDSVPRVLGPPLAFWSLIGLFFVAQLCFVAALWPHRSLGALRGMSPRGAGIVGLVILCLVVAASVVVGPLAGMVVCYATAILIMALLATGLGQAGVVGGALFVLSDGLIALRTFADLQLPLGGVAIMLTYTLAQLFLTAGFLGLEETEADARAALARAA